jgi:hypothetical protein
MKMTLASRLPGKFANGWRTVRSPASGWWRQALVVFILSRLLIFVMVGIGGASLPPGYNHNFYDADWKSEGYFSFWYRYDAWWYVEIAETGYQFEPGSLTSVSWFPAYPLLMRALAPIFGNPLLAGLAISNICFLFVLLLLYRLTISETGDHKAAERVLVYVAIHPSTMFFSAVYTESFFLLLALIVTRAARNRQWWLAAIAGAIASATRIPGIALMALVGMEWLAAHGWTLRSMFTAPAWRGLWAGVRTDTHNLLKILLIMPLGLLAYMAYLQYTFGNALAFIVSTRADGRRMDGPLDAIVRNLQGAFDGSFHYPYNLPVDLGLLLLALALLVPIALRLRESYAVFVLLSLAPALISGSTRSLGRYTMVLFPILIMLALYGRDRRIDLFMKILWLPTACIFAMLYGKWYFVG